MGSQVHSEKWLVDAPTTIDVALVRTVKAGLVAGQVDIVAHDEPGARVEVHAVSGNPLRVELEGDVLRIDHAQFRWDNLVDSLKSIVGRARADISIVVPRSAELTVGTVSADALLTGVHADASLSTVSGELTVDGVRGDVRLDSVSGELSVRAHDGGISAHTVSGDLTASGELSSVSSDGVSGDVYLDVAGTPDEIRVTTVSGSVTARLGADVATAYSISTVGGRIHLDEGRVRGVRGQYTGRYGSLEKHWLDFRVTTVGGGVNIVRAPASDADARPATAGTDA